MLTYIYQVTNILNGKVYFGKTRAVAGRWQRHVWDAAHGSKAYFHSAIRKYSPKAFILTVLSRHETDAEANLEEIRHIASAPPGSCYNTAPGGTGGHTMTPEQIERQYKIKPASYAELRRLFAEGQTATAIAEHLRVSLKAVQRCARRLGLSFQIRRAAIPGRMRTKKKRRCISRAQYTPEARSRLRSNIAAQSNIARGVPAKMKKRIQCLYFQRHLTAQEVANQLGVSKGSVRATINKFYAEMPPEARVQLKHTHGSAVRAGVRNPNAKAHSP